LKKGSKLRKTIHLHGCTSLNNTDQLFEACYSVGSMSMVFPASCGQTNTLAKAQSDKNKRPSFHCVKNRLGLN
jgi:hypothetical protein